MAKAGPDRSGFAKGVPVPNKTNFVWAKANWPINKSKMLALNIMGVHV
jgi:hypothetical protein